MGASDTAVPTKMCVALIPCDESDQLVQMLRADNIKPRILIENMRCSKPLSAVVEQCRKRWQTRVRHAPLYLRLFYNDSPVTDLSISIQEFYERECLVPMVPTCTKVELAFAYVLDHFPSPGSTGVVLTVAVSSLPPSTTGEQHHDVADCECDLSDAETASVLSGPDSDYVSDLDEVDEDSVQIGHPQSSRNGSHVSQRRNSSRASRDRNTAMLESTPSPDWADMSWKAHMVAEGGKDMFGGVTEQLSAADVERLQLRIDALDSDVVFREVHARIMLNIHLLCAIVMMVCMSYFAMHAPPSNARALAMAFVAILMTMTSCRLSGDLFYASRLDVVLVAVPIIYIVSRAYEIYSSPDVAAFARESASVLFFSSDVAGYGRFACGYYGGTLVALPLLTRFLNVVAQVVSLLVLPTAWSYPPHGPTHLMVLIPNSYPPRRPTFWHRSPASWPFRFGCISPLESTYGLTLVSSMSCALERHACAPTVSTASS